MGQLGVGDTADRWTPVLLNFGAMSTLSVNSVALGNYHALALAPSGKVLTPFFSKQRFLTLFCFSVKVYGWGYNANNQVAFTSISLPLTIPLFFFKLGLGDSIQR